MREVHPFTKIVNPAHYLDHNDRKVQVFCKIEWTGERLSISGVEGPKRNGDAVGSCGQIEMHYRTDEERAVLIPEHGWDATMIGVFFDLWDEWHLNDAQAGSPAQTEWVRAHKFPGYPTSHYDWASDGLAAAGLNPDPDHLIDGEPYKYGSKWLTVVVPPEVLFTLSGLPHARRDPAWV